MCGAIIREANSLQDPSMEPWDVTVVGGGILGTSIAYWLAKRYEGRIAVLEKERDVAEHTSRRNTGVVHRPFYLDPVGRKVFARCAQVAYGMWKDYAAARRLPWLPVSTFEVATREEGVSRLEKYLQWGLANGMGEDELELLSPKDVLRYEPNVRCHGAIWSKTDTAVEYHAFTESLRADAESAGAKFLLGVEVGPIDVAGDLLEVSVAGPGPGRVYVDPRRRIQVAVRSEPLRTRFLINCAGGASINLAHRMGIGLEYTDLHFRGEYWEVDPAHHDLSSRNIYTVPRHPELPFLDPHWIVRADGRREIGPNAVPVSGPYTYRGFFGDPKDLSAMLLESPLRNKLRLLVNPDFLNLAAGEWASSLSKGVMAKRAQQFLPALRVEYLVRPGTAGVRASVVDRGGNFVKEAIELPGPHSFHITNYNSPGATGAPAFAAWIVQRLARSGQLDHLKAKAPKPSGSWDFDRICAAIEAPAS
jgi:L-2-hydroxyglutarate oxidase